MKGGRWTHDLSRSYGDWRPPPHGARDDGGSFSSQLSQGLSQINQDTGMTARAPPSPFAVGHLPEWSKTPIPPERMGSPFQSSYTPPASSLSTPHGGHQHFSSPTMPTVVPQPLSMHPPRVSAVSLPTALSMDGARESHAEWSWTHSHSAMPSTGDNSNGTDSRWAVYGQMVSGHRPSNEGVSSMKPHDNDGGALLQDYGRRRPRTESPTYRDMRDITLSPPLRSSNLSPRCAVDMDGGDDDMDGLDKALDKAVGVLAKASTEGANVVAGKIGDMATQIGEVATAMHKGNAVLELLVGVMARRGSTDGGR
ncbi:hypothetical protein CBR_g31228 [Chara braunii]|uniref:Uncharacterized protein n=1 Tax=Chara braunii TaxID=69332 RepID=A0A388JXX2_CHABU|nr:hypothetical protein CBR_g31228 [Chara braunii]|eukprot:GBG62592.1 hypothetical protein CBR_g31228 [Chara braunii]